MQVSGTVEKDGAAMKGLSFKGKWDVELVADLPDGSSRRLWEKNPPAADPSRSECLHPAVQACRALLKCQYFLHGNCASVSNVPWMSCSVPTSLPVGTVPYCAYTAPNQSVDAMQAHADS